MNNHGGDGESLLLLLCAAPQLKVRYGNKGIR